MSSWATRSFYGNNGAEGAAGRVGSRLGCRQRGPMSNGAATATPPTQLELATNRIPWHFMEAGYALPVSKYKCIGVVHLCQFICTKTTPKNTTTVRKSAARIAVQGLVGVLTSPNSGGGRWSGPTH